MNAVSTIGCRARRSARAQSGSAQSRPPASLANGTGKRSTTSGPTRTSVGRSPARTGQRPSRSRFTTASNDPTASGSTVAASCRFVPSSAAVRGPPNHWSSRSGAAWRSPCAMIVPTQRFPSASFTSSATRAPRGRGRARARSKLVPVLHFAKPWDERGAHVRGRPNPPGGFRHGDQALQRPHQEDPTHAEEGDRRDPSSRPRPPRRRASP